MKVLHVINSLATGGAEKLVLATVPLLVKKGHVVDVLVLNGIKGPFYKELQKLNCCTIHVLGNSYYQPFYMFSIRKYLVAYDLIHVHLFPSQYFVALANLVTLKPKVLVFTEHSTQNRRLNNTGFKYLERLIYRQYEKIICITAGVKDALIDKLALPAQKLLVIENGIDVKAIGSTPAYDRSILGYQKSDQLLIMVAGFRKEKDQDTVVKAMLNLPAHFHLIFVGDGERKPAIMQLAAELNLTSRIKFLGVRTDVYALLQMADIAVLSSHWEGFGLAAVEAMAAGLPVLASDVPGLAQVVTAGGLLFEKGNEKQLAQLIQEISSDQVLYAHLVDAGVTKAKLYGIENMVNATEQLYQSLAYNSIA